MLKRDGNLGIHGDESCITKIVRNYLKHEMVTLSLYNGHVLGLIDFWYVVVYVCN